ncbi:unnamed protein product [Owenia fusiformis]|uniref:Tyrosine-protein kinase n=1 Tax=Owenia fusiformis TaxID=6347 RepID=A0A8J1UDA1_OWEFU|nr:unnamed protein product [Owenia fusiformis]
MAKPMPNLNESLLKDANYVKRAQTKVSWYHGEIRRTEAERRLKKDGHAKNGLFLIRDSSHSDEDFVLSLMYNGEPAHFQIQRTGDAFYCIDEGPIIHGLDDLVDHYNADADGLPTNLQEICMGTPPPEHARRFGVTNYLHRAIRKGNEMEIKKILGSASCPDINAKSKTGSTALHQTSEVGMDDIIRILIDNKADVNAKDADGCTSVQRAAQNGHDSTIQLLVTYGGADPHDRCTVNGYSALHFTAECGDLKCMKMLLSLGAPCQPRDDNCCTPYTVAIQNGKKQCAKYLEQYTTPPAMTSQADWLHTAIDRHGALSLLQSYNFERGLFLVRKSSRNPQWYVLAISDGNGPYNYEIRWHENHWYYIDEGPYLDSLEHVVEHYCLRKDGLPCRITTAISPDGKTKEIIVKSKFNSDKLTAKNSTTKSHPVQIPPKPVVHLQRGSPSIPTMQAPPIPQEAYMKSDTLHVHNVENVTLKIIKASDITLGHELGQGEFGSVLRGTWKSPKGERIAVAVKTLHEHCVQAGTEEFKREASVMMGLDHPCIVQLIGLCLGPPMMLVQELVTKGSLLDFLLDYPEKINVETDLYLWGAQIACGMMYLERKRFVHRDLATRNILLVSKQQAKISDFGLSRAIGTGSDYYKASAGGRWPVKWYAPESVNYGTFSHASDVWSYGVTLWEMFSFGEQPYGDRTGAQVIQMIEQGGRLHRPKKCLPKVYELMMRCWSYKPSDRPTFQELNSHFSSEPEYESTRDLVFGR